ncbi:MAG: undecaprenyldiphospho-muramoylpentapeptide beta-N-acetylglucosaminyltransferase [Syntrophomonadaceae bacterium]|jgi:UDP-N-acetylglucosamine--N-acetylmuramyl-(pentapeptide) pyrophosphoryl-undecaprenol N-acetylglucosamine transferase
MKIIITGGGTGGHIYPALAIAQEIKDQVPGVQILYIGTKGGMESNIVPRSGFPFKTIDISGISRSSLFKAYNTISELPRSIFQGWRIVKEFRPDIVIGTGGYVSFPVVLAATFSKCKTFIHEQNALPGLTNRCLARRVDCVMLTFAEAKKHIKTKKVQVTGLPVRKDISNVDIEHAYNKLGLAPNKFTLLVFGGSRGAMSINRAMLKAMEQFQHEDMQIIWLTGEKGYEEVKNNLADSIDINHMSCVLKLEPYLHDMNYALAISDLALCRAGASTLCELAIVGLPAILVPYPFAADNHQEMNARALLHKNAAYMVIDKLLNGDNLFKKVSTLRSNQNKLKEMSMNIRKEARPNALKDIVSIILNS